MNNYKLISFRAEELAGRFYPLQDNNVIFNSESAEEYWIATSKKSSEFLRVIRLNFKTSKIKNIMEKLRLPTTLFEYTTDYEMDDSVSINEIDIFKRSDEYLLKNLQTGTLKNTFENKLKRTIAVEPDVEKIKLIKLDIEDTIFEKASESVKLMERKNKKWTFSKTSNHCDFESTLDRYNNNHDNKSAKRKSTNHIYEYNPNILPNCIAELNNTETMDSIENDLDWEGIIDFETFKKDYNHESSNQVICDVFKIPATTFCEDEEFLEEDWGLSKLLTEIDTIDTFEIPESKQDELIKKDVFYSDVNFDFKEFKSYPKSKRANPNSIEISSFSKSNNTELSKKEVPDGFRFKGFVKDLPVNLRTYYLSRYTNCLEDTTLITIYFVFDTNYYMDHLEFILKLIIILPSNCFINLPYIVLTELDNISKHSNDERKTAKTRKANREINILMEEENEKLKTTKKSDLIKFFETESARLGPNNDDSIIQYAL